MTDDCRCLVRGGFTPSPQTAIAPDPRTPQGAEERERLAIYLSGALMKPLHHSTHQHQMAVEQSLNTMSHAERVYLEIEMTERAKVMHSYDYDALR